MASAADTPVLLAAEPQLLVTDMAAALAFYVEELGFRPVFAYGDPPFYAQVARDGVKLDLRWVRPPVLAAGFREREPDALAAVITVAGVAALFEAWSARGVAMHQALRREPWGAWTFIVSDPGGNLIAFAGDAT